MPIDKGNTSYRDKVVIHVAYHAGPPVLAEQVLKQVYQLQISCSAIPTEREGKNVKLSDVEAESGIRVRFPINAR